MDKIKFCSLAIVLTMEKWGFTHLGDGLFKNTGLVYDLSASAEDEASIISNLLKQEHEQGFIEGESQLKKKIIDVINYLN